MAENSHELEQIQPKVKFKKPFKKYILQIITNRNSKKTWIHKVNFLLLMFTIYVMPVLGQDYQIKFFAYPEQSEILALKDKKWTYQLSPNQHFYILFEKRQEYKASYSYSPDNFISKYPFEFNSRAFGVISSSPLYAHSFSISEETFQLLKPDSLVYFFPTLYSSLAYANNLLLTLGKKLLTFQTMP